MIADHSQPVITQEKSTSTRLPQIWEFVVSFVLFSMSCKVTTGMTPKIDFIFNKNSAPTFIQSIGQKILPTFSVQFFK